MEKGVSIKGRIVNYQFYENEDWDIDIAQRQEIEKAIDNGQKQGGLLNREGYWILKEDLIIKK